MVDALAIFQQAVYAVVDLPVGTSFRRQGGGRDAGLGQRLERVVALVGDAHELVTKLKGEDDFRRAGQQRDDSHEVSVSC